MEGARNAVLSLLAEDGTLRLTDIALMAPDINEFAPFIEALFGEEDRALPYNFIDLRITSYNVCYTKLLRF